MDSFSVLNFFEKTHRLPENSSDYAGFNLGNTKPNKRVESVHQARQGTIYIDVTDTDSCPIISGIQRVVREIVASFVELKIDFELIRFDFDISGFVVLSVDERSLFLKRLTQNSTSAVGVISALTDVFYKISRSFVRSIIFAFNFFGKGGIFSAFVDGIEALKPSMVRKIRSQKKRQYVLHPFMPLEGVKILLPELIYEKGRASQYLALKKYFNADITVILYDLIPVYHPDLTEVSKEFLHYLRVVRECRKVIAISEYSADQISYYLKGWQRERSEAMPKVEAVYLPFTKKAKPIEPQAKFEVPTFLFVSTIEPRKNHLSLVKASLLLKELGLKFEVICVGKMGWIEYDSMNEIQALCAKGAPVRFMHDVSDRELTDLMDKSWCAIYPSVVEGFGLPIIEADQAKLPVIVSENSAMRDVCQQFVTCYKFINPQSVQDIAEAMKSFLDNSTEDFVHNTTKGKLLASWEDYSKAIYEKAKSN